MKRFLIGSLAVLLIASPLVALGAIGAAFLASPNERPAEFAPLALDAIGPEPRLVELRVVRRDAWMQVPGELGGGAYVRRAASGEIVVLSASHPRMGDFLEYKREAGCFESGCYYSRFDLAGRWQHDPKLSMYPVADMRRLEHRVDGDRLFVRAPVPRPSILDEQ